MWPRREAQRYAFRRPPPPGPMSAPRITEEQQAETFAVRLVPISASQIQALESLARAFSGLTTDFWRD
jgi:hypothetical protein